MDDQLAREVRLADDQPPQSTRDELVSVAGEASLRPEVQALIARCMDGSEPYPAGVERKYYEQQKFNSQNIQVVLLRAAGFKQVEIATMLEINPQRVNVTLNHPYGKKILHALLPQQVTRVIDIRTRMEEQAGQLMDHAFKLAVQSDDLKVVAPVTFGFLDRAGYNPVNKTQAAVGKPQDFIEAASRGELNRLTSALDESNCVNSEVMPGWVAPRPPEDTASKPSGFSTFDEVSAAEDESVAPQSQSSGSDQRRSTDQGSQSAAPTPRVD